MSSIERPSVPRTPPRPVEASEVSEDNRGEHLDGESSQKHGVALDADVCTDFLTRHLRAPPSPLNLTTIMQNDIQQIRKVGSSESMMYKPAASLLTAISKEMYRLLDKKQQKAHSDRYNLQGTDTCYLTFIDHHSTAPTCFPNDALSDVKDAPDLLGVYDIASFEDDEGCADVYKGVPHHRVEAIVEAKFEKNGGGRRQAATYAYRHHQARPDRPGFYVLVIKPQWYQVLYSDPTGLFASPQTSWSDTDILVAYLYSHYLPPDKHSLCDGTIRWRELDGDLSRPSWEITCDGKLYKDGQFVFIGEPWSRLTTAFDVEDPSGNRVTIKDSYRGAGRRFKEEEVLDHIHADGDFLGVVRLQCRESVKAGDEYLVFDLKGEEEKRRRERWVFLDSGSRFLKARTVQDLLMAVYDTLEVVHRSQLHLRNVLHRDMSSYNILMYPVWGDVEGGKVNPNLPPMIQDVLAGSARPVEKRFPSCLSIDYDNAALLGGENTNPEGLKHRTGTPMYIARSVCLGAVSTEPSFCVATAMPKLSDEALAFYVRAYGEQRYGRYNDRPLHGIFPNDTEQENMPPPAFRHRPEHDVESVYWSMVSALLRVHPKNADRETQADKSMVQTWYTLLSHEIPDQRSTSDDARQTILLKTHLLWKALFFGAMEDVAGLLWKISRQVNPEYALWEDGLQPDHLHEAVQRLILQYLVDHKEPVELDPDFIRPIAASIRFPEPTKQISITGQTAGSTSHDKRLTKASTRSSQTRVDAERSSKRLRNNAGLPQSIEEHSEEEA